MVDDLKCPYCGQTVNKKQFEESSKKFKNELDLEYRIKIEELHKNNELKIDMMNKSNQLKIEEINKERKLKIEELTQELIEQEHKIKEESSTKEHKIQELIYEKERLLQNAEYEQSQAVEKTTVEYARKINDIISSNDELVQGLRSQLKEDSIMNIRLTEELNKLQDQVRKKQSELIGEVGEIVLLDLLKETFKDDDFITQSRGTSEADIIQTIKHNNQVLDIRICYDNKQNTLVTKTHVDKAKMYQQIHNTKYVILVSSVLPKTDIPNSFIGEKDGIILVHPKIVGAVVTILRENLITIHTKNLTQANRDTKESQLYDFITSTQFARQLSVISNCYSKLTKLLQTEKTSHTRSWKQRQKILEELFHTKIDLEQEIIVLTGKNIPEVKIDATEPEQEAL